MGRGLGRRAFLGRLIRSAAAAGLARGLPAGLLAAARPVAAQALNPIAAENALPGDQGWRLTRRAAPGELEAYAGATSVQRGATIDIHARAGSSHTLTWRLYRMGWYGGAEGRLIAQGGPVPVGPQPVPSPSADTGLVECAWPTTFSIATDPAWTSGVYLVRLQRDDGPQSYATFVLRADERKGVAVVQASVTTYQAYNAYGGRSLYVGPAQEVSYDRPYAEGNGAGQYFRYEHAFVKWAEGRGLDLTYLTNLDVDADPALLLGQRLFLSVGHDEYWTRAARGAVEAAVASGVSAAFLSGNSVFWQIRLEPTRHGPLRARRTQVCYKKASARDPLRGTPLETVQFRQLDDPENALMGVMYTRWVLVDAAWVVSRPDHWLYEGTGLAAGDSIPGIVGYEVDRSHDNGRSPAGLEVVARSPVTGVAGEPDWHEAAVWTAPSGAFVLGAGSIEFAWGLGSADLADARVQRMGENVFRRAGLAPTTPPGPPPAAPPPVDLSEAIASVTTLAGAPFAEGRRDGPAAQARFSRPTGACAGPDGTLYVADTGNHCVRAIRPDAARTVETIAGDGTAGDGEGPGGRLNDPEDVVVDADGTLVVSDTGNDRLVRLRPTDAGWTLEACAGASGWNGAVDGPAAQARFDGPAGLARVGDAIYVADRQNHLIRCLQGGRVTTVAGANDGGWYRDGAGRDARFHLPSGLAAGADALHVVDSGNRVLRRVALDGTFAVTTTAGTTGGGYADGPADQARFMPQAGVALDGDALLVADGGNARLRRVQGGRVRTLAGTGAVGGADGPGARASFGGPTAIVPLGGGRWLVVDQGASTLRIAGPQVGLPPAGQPGGGSPGSGQPGPAEPGTAPPTTGGGSGGCASAGDGAAALLAAVPLALAARAARGGREDS